MGRASNPVQPYSGLQRNQLRGIPGDYRRRNVRRGWRLEMVEPKQLPVGPFRLTRIYAVLQEQGVVNPGTVASATAASIRFLFDWQFPQERVVEVLIGIELDAYSKRPEYDKVKIAGRFELNGDVPEDELLRFVRTNAPAILFPYARETLSNLTGRGPFGKYLLPPLNVLVLMKDLDDSNTRGMEQLRERARSGAK